MNKNGQSRKIGAIRKWHSRIAIAMAIPIFFTIFSGSLMVIAYKIPGLSHVQVKTQASDKKASLNTFMTSLKKMEQFNINSIYDLESLSIDFKRGRIVATPVSTTEIVLDWSTGAVLGHKTLTTRWIRRLHIGDFFGPGYKYWLLLPTGLSLVSLSLLGSILAAHHLYNRRKKKSWRSKKLRDWHRLIAIIFFLPAMVIFTSGILLAIRNEIPSFQISNVSPPTTGPAIDLSQIITIAKSIKELDVHSKKDIRKILYKPKDGIVLVKNNSRIEAVLHLTTGNVLKIRDELTYILKGLHTGLIFGPIIIHFFFISTGIAMLFLLFSGLRIKYPRIRR